jgi:hypothetical protein
LKKRRKCSISRHVAETLNCIPRNRGGVFCLDLLGVAKSISIRMDRTQWFAVEVGNSRHSAPQRSGYKIAYKTHPLFLRYLINQLMDTCPNARERFAH